MSLITAKGNEAKENTKKGDLDLKEIYLRLKDGEAHKVRLLGIEDYVEFTASGDYNNGIFVQAISGPDSPLVIAHKKGGDKFKDLYNRPRYVFVFGSVETGKLVAFEGSKNQAKSLISTIEEYAEEDVYKDIAFNFKRTGSKKDTVYSLSPIIRMKKEDQKAFDALAEEEVTMEFFESIILPKDDAFLVKLLSEIDPTVVDLFPDIDISDIEDKEDGEDNEEQAKPIDVGEDDLPF